jgi:hypothetical protein
MSLADVLAWMETNAGTGWSVGPPRKDNVLKIESITMYYNKGETMVEC